MFSAPSPLPTDFCIGTFGTVAAMVAVAAVTARPIAAIEAANTFFARIITPL
jgi:hypothetical protein